MLHDADLVRVNVMLSREDLAALDRMAQARRLSRSAMLRDIISRAAQGESAGDMRFIIPEPPLRHMTFMEALEVARNAGKRLKGFDGVAEIRKWREH